MENQKTILSILAIAIIGSFFAQAVYAANTIVATIPVSSGPFGAAYDSGKHEIFVTRTGSGTVAVIDDTSNTVTATITVGFTPFAAAYDSAKGEIFVANKVSNTVSVIDDTSNTVTATIPVGTNPVAIAYDSAKGEIFVANSGDNTVSVISDSSNTVTATILGLNFPTGAAYDSGKGEIFVTNEGGNSVSVIDDTSNTVTATILGFDSPQSITYDSGKGEIFVTNSNSAPYSVISDTSNTVTATVSVTNNSPGGVAYDSAKGEIFVANSGGFSSGTVAVIDDTTHTVITYITIGRSPVGVAYDSAKGEVFVANQGSSTVSVIDAGDPVASTSSSGHDVTTYHPPSLGNDYYYKYGSGFTLNGKSFDITKYGITIPQQVLKTGQADNFTFKIYDERGGDTISHVGMYIHFKGDASVANADTSLVWDKKDGVQISDPHKLFTDANVTRHYDTNFAYVSIKFTPAKTMPDSSILMRMWDDKLASVDLPINGAIIIVDPNAPVPVQKVPDNQYGDYTTLVKLLDSDGYAMPPILHKIREGSDLSSTVDVYWVYDKGADKLTMVETYKDGTIIGDTVYNLVKNPSQPTITDHNYVYIPMQNNRQNPDQEKIMMQQEEAKAEKIIESINIPIKKLS